MTPRSVLPPRLLDALSAFLDDRLDAPEAAALQAALQQNPEWREELRELAAVRSLLRSLPELHSPRNLTLSAEQTSRKRSWNIPSLAYGFGSAFTALAAIFLMAFPPATAGLSAVRAPQTAQQEVLPKEAPAAPSSADHLTTAEPPRPAAPTAPPTSAAKSFLLTEIPVPATGLSSANATALEDNSIPMLGGSIHPLSTASPSGSSPSPHLETPTYSEFLPLAQKAGAPPVNPPSPSEIPLRMAASIILAVLAFGLGIVSWMTGKRQKP
jgi:anti-sigma factor RsiW